ncbi:uncharacterized protein Z519_12812 [Cladophialophora bantiana CBS 173.52]|uniref:Uncharacterized protein n=1 Tax=Cladophialophora bantiana (strain ATCC 10958 / CBS 173.52 / CDC B-1940 / NIH 8579) TaxID=1442370 RepID=A0A0D2E8Z9_CLAB1|nr:uncharacterized protein Z519_12812 [Cladophialophora bantiana CBS 173.52]KIW86581.1 hypothetical protein Z519_12812 [Cladophialophora bantiana CBS 173.52]
MEAYVTFNSDIVSSLLNPVSGTVSGTEEQRHPWRARSLQTFDKPFLRLWDRCSGSRPNADGCMRSRANRGRLDTFKSRKDSLTIHIDHSNWTPTPYISFIDSPSEIEELASLRTRRGRGPMTLTVIDPDERVRNGLPVLNVGDEMEYYDIPDPYKNPIEIIGHWQWDDLIVNENWYQEIIIPAFGRARQAATAESLSNLFTGLSLSTDPSDPTNFFHGFSESSSEELTWDFEDEVVNEGYDSDAANYLLLEMTGSDTDDEAEESNASDDAIKVLEGD